MKLKKILGAVVGHHVMRHRQHKRLLGNALMHARRFGPGKGLLLIGAIAMAGKYLQKRRAAHTSAQLPEAGAMY